MADRRARPQVAPDPVGEGRAHLRPRGVVLDSGQIVDGHLGVAQHAPIGADHGDARAGRPRRAQREGAKLGRRGVASHEGPRLVVQQPADAGELRLEGFHRERLERAGQVQAGGGGREGDEADEGQGELPRDAAPEEVNEAAHHARSASSR